MGLQQNHRDGTQKLGKPHGIPTNKKPPRLEHTSLTSQSLLNTDIVEESEDEKDSVILNSQDECDVNMRMHTSTEENTQITQLVSNYSLDGEEKESLKQLLASLSIDKCEMDRRVVSGNYKRPSLSAKIERS